MANNYINKYMPIERAFELLEKKCLWFSNPEKWRDPYEKRFICAHFADGSDFPWKNRVYCSCFTENGTSEASWNAYSDNSICVQISFVKSKLENLLNSYSERNPDCKVYFDRVEYMQTRNIEKPLSSIRFNPPISQNIDVQSEEFLKRLMLIKRKAFKYEREWRAIIVNQAVSQQSGIEIHFNDIHSLISSITIGPQAGPISAPILRRLFREKYRFNSRQVKWSHLYMDLSDDIILRQ